ncbi:MAG TPA: transposase [Bradyrhizobium sp.]|nr:transposase [Bradyrhizobium sp.]
MSQSLANIVVHLVFSTKGRRPLLRDQERGELHAYITGVLKNLNSPLIEINSVRDHIHILFAQSKNHAPAKIVEQAKTASSAWIKSLDAWYSDFHWQTGARRDGFQPSNPTTGLSPTYVEAVRKYIRNQAAHHSGEDFQTEYRRFCEKNGKPLDERHAWD